MLQPIHSAEFIDQLKIISSPDDLKVLGSLKTIKNDINTTFGVIIKARSWQGLYEKIQMLKTQLKSHQHELQAFDEQTDLNTKQLEKLLGFSFRPHTGVDDLIVMLSNCLKLARVLTPAERFELTKRRNFISSSLLEGIKLPPINDAESLDDIINRYRVAP